MSDEKNFEDRLTRLEEIVRTLETGSPSLEESMTLYENGKKLAKSCREQLATAEQKVEKLASQE